MKDGVTVALGEMHCGIPGCSPRKSRLIDRMGGANAISLVGRLELEPGVLLGGV